MTSSLSNIKTILQDLSGSKILERMYSHQLSKAKGSPSFFTRVHKTISKDPAKNQAYVEVAFPGQQKGHGTALVALDELEQLKKKRELRHAAD